MKTRSPWGLYAAVFATCGFFGWVWLVKLMSDVNELAARRVFPIKLLSLFFTVVIAGYCGLVAMMPRGNPDIPGLSYDPSLLIGFAIVILFSPPVFLTLVSRYIDAAAGRPQSIVSRFSF